MKSKYISQKLHNENKSKMIISLRIPSADCFYKFTLLCIFDCMTLTRAIVMTIWQHYNSFDL